MFTKSHKANSGYPSRPVVSQIDDPTYLLCKELTRMLLPIKEKAESFIRNLYHLKEILSKVDLQDFKKYIQISFDMSNMYPSIPIEETLQLVLEELLIDESLSQRTEWKPHDIGKLTRI